MMNDYDPDIDYYFPSTRREIIVRRLGAMVARFKAAVRQVLGTPQASQGSALERQRR